MSNMNLNAVTASILCMWVTSCLTFDLTILHTNDCHARIEQADGNGGSCGDSDALAGKCFGGVARRLTKIREIRESESNVLLLDAGDQFQGTLWFYFYSGLVTARFMNEMQYDVMAFGNHEFDKKVEGVIPFLRAINFTMVSCNIDASRQSELQSLFQPSVVLEVGGERVGVIGYTTPNTTFLVSAGLNLDFRDEVAAITAEVQRLQGQGVNKLIALGHSGIDADITIARQVPGLDLVVGGHSNTFLYNGPPPEDDPKYGEYPLSVRSDVDGRQVLVVQDYAYGKYLGNLKLTFDDDGDVTAFEGNPILLNASVLQDNETLAEVLSLKEEMANLTNQEAGKTHVFLEGRRQFCRRQECNLGNVITDAMVRQNLKNPDEAKWADVSMAVWNSGGIRAPIPFRPPDGIITTADVLTVLPFQNTIDIIVISGDVMFQMFEHSVSNLPSAGQFLQVSGILVTYDISKPVGQRVVTLEAVCTECSIPQYEPVERGRRYKLLINAFMVGGGDGYSMLPENVADEDREPIGYLDTEMVLDYLADASPITTGLERRITILNGTAPNPMTPNPIAPNPTTLNPTSTASSMSTLLTMLLLCSIIAVSPALLQ
ncbi:snake venom 5'-nucleotidase-like isoform X3 [Branchiostoma floridae]|nr:snake venom 5'-nucleotidase-like isoform X3 [Branchiostoma floridae]XP_035687504.1 snake venom 5'-nucleotidase-like isoform X3 [Branchiostoma floridae]XP_035687505.1 snake venom 5'-nucleotidase-like isoform X3 [Branchiostoma floridae]XP_035687506.1 snake venom 5'-nucleotidase-like isoform X3 [Branchiostoma floridae]XP_035687507.1 snake venom 5'-nucleotidase-like isoform X3 [Branchiostoma floridae]XP_035687509.1 snake venom 5'-nucleotidase-like isoform X3 [Branchiostoma floridae]